MLEALEIYYGSHLCRTTVIEMPFWRVLHPQALWPILAKTVQKGVLIHSRSDFLQKKSTWIVLQVITNQLHPLKLL